MYCSKKRSFPKKVYDIYLCVSQGTSKERMEAFRYGLSVPFIQVRASEVTCKVLHLPVRTVVCVTRPKRYRVSRRKKVLPKKKTVLKMHTPPVFSIELDNMFETLDI